MSSVAAAPDRAGPAAASTAITEPRPFRRLADVIAGAALAAALIAIAFLTSSSSGQTVTAANTWTEIALVLAAAIGGAAVLVRGRRAPAWGWPSLALFAAFTAFAGLSIIWSVRPEWAYFGTDQLCAYLAAFAAAMAVARLAPERWPAVVGGLAAASAGLCAWSLIVKVFPATLAPANAYGRLLAPFGYWNALGVVAALGLVPATWAAARPQTGRLARAVCAPALTLMLSVAILSLSRSALLTGAIALVIWFVWAPLRLRSLPMLAAAGAGTIPLVLYVLGHGSLSADSVAISLQDTAGHRFGLVLVIVLVLEFVGGAGLALAMERIAPGPALRRRIGVGLLGLAACIPILAILALAASSRGLTGEISHAWTSLTSATPSRAALSDSSQRLTQLGSSRPLYWHQGLQVGAHALLKGVGELGYGIARLRDTTVSAKSDNAHSYVIQTFADLGLIGIALTLGLLLAWGRAVWRALTPSTPWAELTPERRAERAGMIALSAVAVSFGIQSSLDWTWYFPGVAVPALVAAGWLAGRGPLGDPVGRVAAGARRRVRLVERPLVAAGLLGIAIAALGIAWLQWQPLRSAQQLSASETAPTAAAALADAESSAASNPLATVPDLEIATLLQNAGRLRPARAALRRAVGISPADPVPWIWLAAFDLETHRDRAASREAARVLALDHTIDPTTLQAQAIVGQAGAAIAADQARRRAQRRARASSRRRHSGSPSAART